MNLEKLQELHQARPFRPFAIHMADGRTFTIPHNEFLALHPDSDTLAAYQSGGGLSILDLDLVTELELLPLNGKSNKVGKKSRE